MGDFEQCEAVFLGLSHPHPCGTLFQIIAVLVRRKEYRAHNAAICMMMRRSRKYNNALATEGGGVGQAVVGKRKNVGNVGNRVCRITTDMRTTQGQAAFGHNICGG
jgi:hypothetical protein